MRSPHSASRAALPLVLTLAMVACAGGCSLFDRSATVTGEPPLSPSEQRAEELSARGQTALETGDLSDAMRLFEEALDADPANFDAHLGLGQVHEQTGDLEAAIDAYEQATTLDRTSFTANYRLAHVYHLLDRLTDAVAAYLTALTLDPDDLAANRDLAAAYMQLEQPTMALPYAERAAALDGADQAVFVNLGAVYASLERWEDALQAYREANEHGDLTPPIASNLVTALIRTGRYTQALNTLGFLVRTDPQPRYYERLGYVNFKAGDYQGALDAYQQANELDPDDVASLNGLGVALMTRYIQTNRQYTHLRDRALNAWRRSLVLDDSQDRIIDLLSRYARL